MPFALLAITSGSCDFLAILDLRGGTVCSPWWSDRSLLPWRPRFLHFPTPHRRDVEAVRPVLVRKELQVFRARAQRRRAFGAQELGRRHRAKFRMLREEPRADLLVLAAVDRACRLPHPSPRPAQGPVPPGAAPPPAGGAAAPGRVLP